MVEQGRDYQRRWDEGGRRQRRKQAQAAAPRNDYYGVPVIHKPHWKWLIIWYFFLGGLSGASYVVGSLARLAGAKENAPIVRTARYVSFAALLPSPILLILDLGRPERFLNMLRVVKLRSPMSLGTWGLLAFSGFCTLSTAAQAARDGLLGRNRASRALAALPTTAIDTAGMGPAFFLSGYTGVLLSATAVPLWAKNARFMGPLFLSSGMSSACAAIGLALAQQSDVNRDARERMERLETVALVGEATLLAISYRQIGEFRTPVTTGHVGRVASAGAIGAGVLAPTLLRILGRVTGRKRAFGSAAGALTLVGGFCLRYAAVEGGKISADDPHATFAFTKKER